MKKNIEKLIKYPIVPVFYHDDLNTCKEIISSCYAGGIRFFEFLNRGEYAASNLERLLFLRRTLWPELLLGIGTIKSVVDFKVFSNLGADFLVSPFWSYDLAEISLKEDVVWIPGCMTVTEVGLAENMGIKIVKIFPGNVLGKDFLKAIRPLFPKLDFMITGGVEPTIDSVLEWKLSGATAVGIGAKLFSSDISQISNTCKELLSVYQPDPFKINLSESSAISPREF